MFFLDLIWIIINEYSKFRITVGIGRSMIFFVKDGLKMDFFKDFWSYGKWNIKFRRENKMGTLYLGKSVGCKVINICLVIIERRNNERKNLFFKEIG